MSENLGVSVQHFPHLAVKRITDVDGHRNSVLLMKARLTSTEFGSVFNIIMDEEPILEEFK